MVYEEKVTRNIEIARRYNNGESSPKLAREYNITRQRVWSIVKYRDNKSSELSTASVDQ